MIPLVVAPLLGCAPPPFDPSNPATGSSPSDAGDPREVQEDRTTVPPHPAIDVLLVVDPTQAATTEREVFGAGMASFLAHLSGNDADWRIGVVSASPTDRGALREVEGHRWVDGTTENPTELLALLAEVPRAPAARFTAVVPLALSANPGFERSDSALRVVVVGTGRDDSPDPSTFDAWFLAQRATPTLRSFSCVVRDPVESDCALTSEAVGGLSVEPSDLSALALHVAGLSQRFLLTRFPVVDSIRVSVEDSNGVVVSFPEGGDWRYDLVSNAVVFHDFIPRSGETTVVRYEVASP